MQVKVEKVKNKLKKESKVGIADQERGRRRQKEDEEVRKSWNRRRKTMLEKSLRW